ncbi:transcription factor TFIIIB component B'' homolog isoform X2 [Aethina tumida]|uniref:transcription factor TFIIIB component B'' homolog isoform X2 n=1 Tax=Aethina tumida TaxID=116153 RepID=UPI00096B57B2|nr:transcription factor TFIIIB component B'' homolog isoform X2 [Aethina tumida]
MRMDKSTLGFTKESQDTPGMISKEFDFNGKLPIVCNTNTSDNIIHTLSPDSNKINSNRPRIKPQPKLNQRNATKINFNKVENESNKFYNGVCSKDKNAKETATFPISTSLQNGNMSASKTADYSTCFKTKCLDGRVNKLTMGDYIYYNPKTNPPKNGHRKRRVETIVKPEDKIINAEEQDTNVYANKSDEENDMPAPQVKVGPDGEIILDEASLMIENKQIKKAREDIQKSAVINGDDASDAECRSKLKTNRSKSWTKDEILRFYRALSLVGTDFSLMCDLFPNRTRKQIKLKFKREEKANPKLIDKALSEPPSCEYHELKWEAEREIIESELLASFKEDARKFREERKEQKRIKFIERRKIEEEKEMLVNANKQQKKIPAPNVSAKPTRKRSLNIFSILSDEDL